MNAKQLLDHLKDLEERNYPLHMHQVSMEMDSEDFFTEDNPYEIFLGYPDFVNLEGCELKFSGGYTDGGYIK